MTDGKVFFNRLSLQLADADYLVFARNFVSKIIKNVFSKSIEVGIPGGSGPHVIASVPCLRQDLVPFVLHSDGGFFAGFRRFGENGVKGPIFFSAFLNVIEIVSLFINDPRDPQVRQQSKLENPLAGDQWLEGDDGSAE